FMYFLFGKMKEHYVAIFFLIASFYLVCFTLMCVLVKEGEYPPPPPPVEGGALARFFGAVGTYFRECLTHPYYLWFFLSFFLAHDAGTFAAAHVICGTCSGFWLTATAPLGPALLPKLKFATFASVLIVASSVAQGITSPIIGAIVTYLNRGKPPLTRDYHVM